MSAAVVLLAGGAVTWVLRIAMITLLPVDRLPAAAAGCSTTPHRPLAGIVGTSVAGRLVLPELAARLPVLVVVRRDRGDRVSARGPRAARGRRPGVRVPGDAL
jgi:hypothetical protein